MKVIQIRVDSRLIHGQVANFWTNHLNVNRIMVISNEIVKDKMQVEMLKLSCPEACKLTVCKVVSAQNNLKNEKYENERILIIIPNIKSLVQFFEEEQMYELCRVVNLGNIPKREHTINLSRTVHLLPSEIEDVKEIDSNVSELILQMVPNNQVVTFQDALNEVKG